MRRFGTSLVCICVIAVLTSTLSPVVAQTTSITNLAYPTSTVSNGTAVVTFDLTYSGLTTADVLVAFIYDTVGNSIANGAASSSPEHCMSLTGTQYSNDAACVWRPTFASGSDDLSFNLQFSGTHIQTYDFAAAAGAYSYSGLESQSAVSFTEQPFAITAGTTVELTVDTTYPVAVTIDGSLTASGPIEVTPGVHTVSIPTIVQIDNVSRLKFEHWDDGITQANRTLNIQTDTTIDAIFVRQYLLTLTSPTVAAMGSGWYDESTIARFSVPPSVPFAGILGVLGAKLVFNGWYENGKRLSDQNSGQINMLDAHTLTAEWNADYTIPIVILGVVAIAIIASVVILVRKGGRRKNRRKRSYHG